MIRLLTIRQEEHNFKEEDVPFYSLCDYASILEVALEQKYITSEQQKLLEVWRNDPANWD